MSSLRLLALANTTTNNDGYNEAIEIARAANMEGDGAILRHEYTFEEYIARRGNFINKLPEYKHLPNACWIVRKHTAGLIFHSETDPPLPVMEVRRRELASEVTPLLPLPTTANTQTIDNFASCRPEGLPEQPVDEDEDDGRDREEWYDCKTPGSPYRSAATSPVEGESASRIQLQASTAEPVEASPSFTNQAGLDVAVEQSGRLLARSVQFDASNANQPTRSDHAIVLPGITITSDEQPVVAQQDMGVESIDKLRLSVGYGMKPAVDSGDQTGISIDTSHIGAVVLGPKTTTGGPAQAAPASSLPEPNMLTDDQAQTRAAASVPEPKIALADTFKPGWKALSTGQVQAGATTPPVNTPTSSPAKFKVFTPDPRVSSMAGYGIVTPVKNKDDTKKMEQSALKPSTPVAIIVAPTQNKEDSKDTKQPASKPATQVTTKAAPEQLSRPEVSTAKTTKPAEKSSSPVASIEPASKRLKGSRGVAHPVKTPASTAPKNTKTTPSPATDNPSTTLSKTARRLESIIAGTALPKTKAEARAAATEHHSRLLAAHAETTATQQATDPNRRKSGRITAPKPNTLDLMPFFFSRPTSDATAKKSKKGGKKEEEEEEDFIRCICGITHDEGENMICCEACEVWQHSACVVPGLAEGQLEALKWECTNCDPWGNREVLKGLRAGVVKAREELNKVKGTKRRASGAV